MSFELKRSWGANNWIHYSGTSYNFAISRRALMHPADTFDTSKQNSGGTVKISVQTYAHVLGTQHRKESMLWIHVSNTSRRSLCGLHLRNARSGIDARTEWYACAVFWCNDMRVEVSRPALIRLSFILLIRAFSVCLCVQLLPSLCVCSSHLVRSSANNIMSGCPTRFQKIERVFP